MMLRSKSTRSGYSDLEDKSHESVLSRTFSASKFCRGDNIGKSVDSNALKTFGRISLDRNPSRTSGRSSLDRNPSKSARFTESQIQRALMVQEHMGQLEQELKWAKDRIFVVEEERKREAKRMPNMKGNDQSLPTKKVGELMTEIKTLKELLSNSKEELRTKDKDIESLRKELEEAKEIEVKLSERDSLFHRMKEDLSKVKESEAFAMNQLLSSKQKIEELEDEVQKGKASEVELRDSLKSQTNQLEQEKVEVEECKLKIASLNQMIISLKTPNKHEENNNDYVPGERKSSEKYEIEFLKKELRSALDAEEKSKKAMDDLALVLQEVATEANQAKEKLRITESDLENAKSEAEQLKQMVRNTEEKYKKLFDEAKKEAEIYRNTAERLRIEAEEALLAWNGKETGFVDCIKRAEEEKEVMKNENNKLNESLKSAEHTTRTVKEESYKLRDILKQAINEANAAKAAATIATDENSQLKDCLSEKDEALHFLTRENERLGISEAAAYENIKEFKRLLTKTSKKFRTHDTLKSPSSMIVENQDELKKVKKPFNLHYKDDDRKNEQKDPEKVEAPDVHHRRESSVFTDDDETTNSDEFDNVEGSNYDDSDSDKNQNRRKNMFRRVGDLMKRRS